MDSTMKRRLAPNSVAVAQTPEMGQLTLVEGRHLCTTTRSRIIEATPFTRKQKIKYIVLVQMVASYCTRLKVILTTTIINSLCNGNPSGCTLLQCYLNWVSKGATKKEKQACAYYEYQFANWHAELATFCLEIGRLNRPMLWKAKEGQYVRHWQMDVNAYTSKYIQYH